MFLLYKVVAQKLKTILGNDLLFNKGISMKAWLNKGPRMSNQTIQTIHQMRPRRLTLQNRFSVVKMDGGTTEQRLILESVEVPVLNLWYKVYASFNNGTF